MIYLFIYLFGFISYDFSPNGMKVERGAYFSLICLCARVCMCEDVCEFDVDLTADEQDWIRPQPGKQYINVSTVFLRM